jgi:hypothetical protein
MRPEALVRKDGPEHSPGGSVGNVRESAQASDSFTRASWLPVVCTVFFILGLVPVVRACYIAATVGGSVQSNDYAFFLPLLDKVLSGVYDWRNYASDTFYNHHFLALPILFHLAIAKLFHWDNRVELYAGLLLAAVRTGFLFLALASRRYGWLNLPLLTMITAIVFGTSQYSVLLFAFNGISWQLALLGFAVALWAVVKLSGKKAIALMLVGGIVSCYSSGNVFPAWIALLLGLIMTRRKSFGYYLGWVSGCVVALFPYIYFIVIHPSEKLQPIHVNAPINLMSLINMLGRPMANGIDTCVGSLPMAEQSCLLGLVALGVVLFFIVSGLRSSILHPPSLMLVTYGLSSAWWISTLRPAVNPWYSGLTAAYWIGMAGLGINTLSASALLAGSARLELKRSRVQVLAGLAGILVLATIVCLYLRSNISWEDKDYYLDSRSEASESALRNYMNAPTYCEGLLFQWGTGNPDEVRNLAEPMRKHQISVFAPRQRWSLHGDWPLQSVQVLEKEGTQPARWVRGLREDAMCIWQSPLPLNLCLHSPNTVIWTLKLPENLERAEFVTRLSLGQIPNAPRAAVKDGVIISVSIMREDGSTAFRLAIPAKRWGQWKDVRVPLSEFKGKTVKLALTSQGGQYAGDDLALFDEPHVNVILEEANAKHPAPADLQNPRPSNTDLSPAFPQCAKDDFKLASLDSGEWKTAVVASDDKCTSLAGFSTELTYVPQLNLPLNDFSHLLIEVQAEGKFLPRLVRARLGREQPGDIFVDIPLLGDDMVHKYTYDLRLLELDPADKVKQLRLIVPGQSAGPLKIVSVSFIRKNQAAIDSEIKSIQSRMAATVPRN